MPGAWISSAGQPTTTTDPASSSRRDPSARAAATTPPAIGPVAAGVHGLDASVRTDRRDSVVETHDPDRAPGPAAGEGRPEGGLHAGDALLEGEASAGESLAEVRGALPLLVPELGMRVNEADRFPQRIGLGVDRRQHCRVVDHAATAFLIARSTRTRTSCAL